jgi:xanthine dehydrogenase iron-sulfur cluster and FAD-binding subunit A
MNKEKILVYSNGQKLVESDNKDVVAEAIEKDYMKQDLCFGEYIEEIVIQASVSDTLSLIGSLYKKIDGDILMKIYNFEGNIFDYNNSEHIQV